MLKSAWVLLNLTSLSKTPRYHFQLLKGLITLKDVTNATFSDS